MCYFDAVARRERWTTLLDMLAADGRIEIEDAAVSLAVSAATIRRDLDELAGQQMLIRSRGGALPHSVSYDLPLRYKTSRHRDQKRRIAEVAAALVVPGGVVGLNGGTTTTEVARALALRSDLHRRPGNPGDADGTRLTVVTNALNIAHELAIRPHVKLVVTGGVARPQSYELIGPLALPVLEHLTLDIAVLGVDGITVATGASTHNEGEAAVNREMASRAQKMVVVADASKLGRSAFARICTVTDIDVLVTDDSADPQVVSELQEAGVEVVTA